MDSTNGFRGIRLRRGRSSAGSEAGTTICLVRESAADPSCKSTPSPTGDPGSTDRCDVSPMRAIRRSSRCEGVITSVKGRLSSASRRISVRPGCLAAGLSTGGCWMVPGKVYRREPRFTRRNPIAYITNARRTTTTSVKSLFIDDHHPKRQHGFPSPTPILRATEHKLMLLATRAVSCCTMFQQSLKLATPPRPITYYH